MMSTTIWSSKHKFRVIINDKQYQSMAVIQQWQSSLRPMYQLRVLNFKKTGGKLQKIIFMKSLLIVETVMCTQSGRDSFKPTFRYLSQTNFLYFGILTLSTSF